MEHTKDFISERRRTDMLHRIEGNLLNHAVGSQTPPSCKQPAAGMISKGGYCANHNAYYKSYKQMTSKLWTALYEATCAVSTLLS